MRLGDVATVVEDHQPLIGDAVAPDDADGDLILVIEKFPDANTLEVTQGVEARWPRSLRVSPASSSTRPSTGRPPSIEMAIGNLAPALLVGAFLARPRARRLLRTIGGPR